eukprot:scaffold2744_cov160-Amphora_coffeaeformis.AAC.4
MSGTTTATQAAVSSALEDHLDSDTCDYIASLLEDDPNDADAREAVHALITGSVDTEDHQVDPEEICQSFFALLDLGKNDDDGDTGAENDPTRKEASSSAAADGVENGGLRKLDQAVTMKDHDVQTFASGLSSGMDNFGNDTEGKANSQIADFYANMIDISNNTAAQSERARRKARQKEIREQLEEEERTRAIEDAMKMLEDLTGGTNDQQKSMQDLLDKGNTAMADIHLRNFDLPNLRGGGENLLQNASLTLARGRRYGLIGYNGCGKTTLMTFLAARKIEGAVPPNMSMLLVRQEIIGNEWTAVETVLKSDVKRESIKRFIAWCEDELQKLEDGGQHQNLQQDDEDETDNAEEETAEDSMAGGKGRRKLRDRKQKKLQKAAVSVQEAKIPIGAAKEAKKAHFIEKLAKAYEKLGIIEAEEGGDPEPRARKVLAGLGFTPEMQDKKTKELSGGWRMLTDVVHFHKHALTVYRGDIANFEQVREDDKKRQVRLREIQETKRAHLQKYIDLHAQSGENGVKAARQRKSKMKKLDKIGVMAQDGKKWKASYDGDAEEVEEFVEDEAIEMSFPDPGSFDGDMVRLEQVSFGYSEDKALLQCVDLNININSRVALLGRKKYIDQARRWRTPSSQRESYQYLAQHQLEQLDPDGTPLSTMVERYPGDRSNTHIGDLRRYLANFGLGGEIKPMQKIHTMSGGEKCRVCLASAMYRKPHLLVLDEPTNHLDLETTEALIQAIHDFAGGVLLVSHDQHLLTSVCKDLIVVEGGTIENLSKLSSSKEAFTAYKKSVVQGLR